MKGPLKELNVILFPIQFIGWYEESTFNLCTFYITKFQYLQLLYKAMTRNSCIICCILDFSSVDTLDTIYTYEY